MFNRDSYGYISNIFMWYHDIFDMTHKSWYIFQYLYWLAIQRNNYLKYVPRTEKSAWLSKVNLFCAKKKYLAC